MRRNRKREAKEKKKKKHTIDRTHVARGFAQPKGSRTLSSIHHVVSVRKIYLQDCDLSKLVQWKSGKPGHATTARCVSFVYGIRFGFNPVYTMNHVSDVLNTAFFGHQTPSNQSPNDTDNQQHLLPVVVVVVVVVVGAINSCRNKIQLRGNQYHHEASDFILSSSWFWFGSPQHYFFVSSYQKESKT